MSFLVKSDEDLDQLDLLTKKFNKFTKKWLSKIRQFCNPQKVTFLLNLLNLFNEDNKIQYGECKVRVFDIFNLNVLTP